MPRISIDAIDQSRIKGLAPFSKQVWTDSLDELLREYAELERHVDILRREARRRGLAITEPTSTDHLPGECSHVCALTLQAFWRTHDPVWLVVAGGVGVSR
jgi:hypothetical protein